jgi:hypothetical protein
MDSFEPNNDLMTATTWNLTPLSSALCSPMDKDFYAIQINQASDIQVNAFFRHANGDIDIRVKNAQGDILADSVSSSDIEQISLRNLQAGTYYLEVFPFGSTFVGNQYRVEIQAQMADLSCQANVDCANQFYCDLNASTCRECLEDRHCGGARICQAFACVEPVACMDQYEPNNDQMSARQIAMLPAIYENVALCTDEDFYALNVPANGHLKASIYFTHSTGDIDLEIIPPADAGLPVGTILRSNGVMDQEMVELNGLPMGMYLVRVYGYLDVDLFDNRPFYNTYRLSVE